MIRLPGLKPMPTPCTRLNFLRKDHTAMSSSNSIISVKCLSYSIRFRDLNQDSLQINECMIFFLRKSLVYYSMYICRIFTFYIEICWRLNRDVMPLHKERYSMYCTVCTSVISILILCIYTYTYFRGVFWAPTLRNSDLKCLNGDLLCPRTLCHG